MNNNETALRAIKDRIASAMGKLDDNAAFSGRKENHRLLMGVAQELRDYANELQNVLMKIKLR